MTLRLVREERFDRGAEIRREQDAAVAQAASVDFARQLRSERRWFVATVVAWAMLAATVVRLAWGVSW